MCAVSNYNRKAQCTMQFTYASKRATHFSLGTTSKGTKQQVEETQMKYKNFKRKKIKIKTSYRFALKRTINGAISYTNTDTIHKHQQRGSHTKWNGNRNSQVKSVRNSSFSLTHFVGSKWIFAKRKSLASVKSWIVMVGMVLWSIGNDKWNNESTF